MFEQYFLELIIKSVRSDEQIHYNVSKWNSLTVGSQCYSVGLMSKGLVLLRSTLKTDGSSFDVLSEILGKEF